MNIKDLEVFLAIAATENMQLAAEHCDKSPSVISKSLKRLETTLNTPLFDRIGKHIKLNATGVKFQRHAAAIVAQAKQSFIECSGFKTEQTCRIAAPSILYFRWASVITKVLLEAQADTAIDFQTYYEQQALEQLKKGQVDLAIVTSAIADQIPKEVCIAPLGALNMQVAAGKSHPLVTKQSNNQEMAISVTTEALLEYSFIAPNTSPYCGENRGLGCDGWQNTAFPRKLNMVANDYAVLGQIVKSGQALAYLPDFWIRELNLLPIEISDNPYQCQEEILLLSLQPHFTDLFAT